ncbi:hypothetical protein D3C87_1636950 [compost metagenome]
MHAILGMVQLQPVAGAAEGVGQDDVGAGIDEVLVQLGDVLGPGLVPDFRRFAGFEAHREQRGSGGAIGKKNASFGDEVGENIGGSGHRLFPARMNAMRYKDIFMSLQASARPTGDYCWRRNPMRPARPSPKMASAVSSHIGSARLRKKLSSMAL